MIFFALNYWVLVAQPKVISTIDNQISLVDSFVKKDNHNKGLALIDSLYKNYQLEDNQRARLMHLSGKVYVEKGELVKADTFLKKAEFLWSKNHDTLHVEYANLQYTIGKRLFYESYKEALPFFNRSLKILKQIENPDLKLYANTLNALGILNEEVTNDYNQAEKYYLESMEIRRVVSGEKSIEYAQSLNNLGVFYDTQGRLEKAKQYYNNSIAIKEKMTELNYESYAYGLMNLASLYSTNGLNEEAEELYLKALNAYQGRVIPKRSFKYAHLLLNIGAFYSQLGQFNKTEKFYLEALNRFESFGKSNFYYGLTLTNLGYIYLESNSLLASKKYFESALDIVKQNTDTGIKYSTMPKNGIALLHKRKKEYLEAEKIWVDIVNDPKIKKHPILHTDILLELGKLYSEINNFEAANNTYLKAVEVVEDNLKVSDKDNFENRMGRLNETRLNAEHSLALLYQKSGDVTAEIEKKLTLFPLIIKQINNTLTFLSVNEQQKYIDSKLKAILEEIQSSAIRLNNSAAFNNLQFNISLIKKGLQLTTERKTLEYVFLQKDSSALNKYYTLLDFRNQLKREIEKPLREEKNIAHYNREINRLEKDLIKRSYLFRKEKLFTKIDWSTIKSKVKPNEAIVEFVHFDFLNPNPTDSIIYAASILIPNSNQAHFIPLFEEKELQNIFDTKSTQQNDLVSKIYASRGIKPVAQKAISKQVYDLVWKQLDSLLVGAETVYYSPSGLLNRLNLNALATSKDQILADKYNMIQLSSTRLLALDKPEVSTEKTAYLVGGVQYDYSIDTTAIQQTVMDQIAGIFYHSKKDSAIDAIDHSTILISNQDDYLSYVDRSVRGTDWRYLKWTKAEAKEISQLMQQKGYTVNLQSDLNATEEAFKAIGTTTKSPSIIHLATHGFFFSDPVDSLPNKMDEPVFKVSEHSMLRSGLLLSGANRVWKGAPPLPDEEDGILTAYEISNMNLSDTELVVLSACETGLGDIKGSEGVYGLQRAFKKAGVRYLMMSLWQVPDRETSIFMRTFYRNYLEKEMSITAAFNTTQKEMQDQFEDPYLWAGFVLME